MVQLMVLTDEEVEAVHQATLRILGETGIIVTLPLARDMLLRSPSAAAVGGRRYWGTARYTGIT
jgi:trimethylamine:corrinoid methyltransferase-like protein